MASELKKKTISSLFWKLLERAGNQVVLLLVQIVMARILTPEDFGLLAIILVFVNLGNVFVQSGLGAALVQNPDVESSDYSTVFWISLAMSIILTIGLFFAAPIIGNSYGAKDLIWPLRVLSVLMIVNAYNSVQVAMVQRTLEFKRVFVATTWSVCTSAVVGIASAIAGIGIWALVVQQLVYQTVNCISLFLQTRWVPSRVFKASRAAVLYRFGWKILACNLLNTGYLSFHDLVVGVQFSTAQLGLVSQGKKYPSALGSMLDGAVQPVMMSSIARVQTNKDKAKRLTRRAIKTSTFVVFPCMMLFAVVAPLLIPFLLGRQWVDSVPFLQMYCFIYALLPIHSTNLSALSGMGRTDINLVLEIIKKIIGLTALVIGAFIVKDIYFLVATGIFTGVISTFVNAYPNKKVIGYSYLEQIRDICPAFGLALVAGAVAYPICFAALPDIVTILLQAVVFMAVYLLLAKLFKVEEFTYLLDTAKEILASYKGRGKSDGASAGPKHLKKS